jgi:hypothetical protein
MEVYNKVTQEDQQSQKDILSATEFRRREFCNQLDLKKTESDLKMLSSEDLTAIAGFVANQDLVVLWEREKPIIHVLRLIGRKEQEDKHRSDQENDRSVSTMRLQKEN